MSRRELGTGMADLIERYTALPDDEKVFAERIFRSGVEIAEERAVLFAKFRDPLSWSDGR